MASRRATRSRKPSDGGLVHKIITLCKLRRLWCWRANAGIAKSKEGDRIRLAPPGTPDVLLVLPGGYLAGLEAKSATGAVRATQRAWARVAADHGVRYAVVRSAAEVVAVLDRWVRETDTKRPTPLDAERDRCTIGTSAKTGGPRRRCERPRGPTTPEGIGSR